MAVRVQNGEILNFGNFGAAATVTHGRISIGADVLTVRPLAVNRDIALGGQAEFAIGEIDLLHPSNQYENAGWNALLALAFNGVNSFNVDLMTDDSTVVAVAGYGQQASTDWDLSTEAD